MKKTGFVGLTHLGQVTSISYASLKKEVVAIDTQKKVIQSLLAGNVTVLEDGLDNLYKKVKKNYTPSTDFSLLKSCELIFFVLDTPTDKPFNTQSVEKLIKKSLPHISPNTTLVIMSQVQVGFTRRIFNLIEKKYTSLNLSLYYLVNTLIIGTSINRFLFPERIIIGSNDSSTPLSKTMQSALSRFKSPVIQMSYESAEMTKSAINLFLASSITTANFISEICECVGADYDQIIPALKSDKRIGEYAYVKPTVRISGGHLEREIIKFADIAKPLSIQPNFAETLYSLNEKRFEWVVKKVYSNLKKNGTICLWGLSYKRDTLSTENSVALNLINRLKSDFSINTFDPVAKMPKNIKGYKRFKDKYKALQGCEGLIILTDWQEFEKCDIEYMLNIMDSKIIIDCVGSLKGHADKITDALYITPGKSDKRLA